MGEPYVVAIGGESSIINYHPQGDGGIGNWTKTGWQPSYPEAGGFATHGGEAAIGNSIHITTYPNASLDFQFYGSAVSLFGLANCSYTVSVDGNTTSHTPKYGQNHTLYAQDGLPERLHNISLVANASNSGNFTFEGAAVSRTLSTGAEPPTAHVYQATNTSFIMYDGNWTVLNDPFIPSQQHPAPYMVTSVPQSSLSFSFQGVGVAINGSRIWGSYLYNVTLDGETESYNASTMWFIGDALLFYRDGLDPHDIHTVNVTPTLSPGGFLKFWLNSVTVFTDDPSEVGGLLRKPTSSNVGSHTPPIGIIVGSVVGGVAFFALIAAALLYSRRRRRAKLTVYERDEPSPFLARAPATPSRADVARDTKRPMPTPDIGDVKHPTTLASDAAVVVLSPPVLAQTSSESSLHRHLTPDASTGDAPAAASATSQAAPTHPATPETGAPAADPNVAVERIIQLLAERMTTEPPRQPEVVEEAPPEYGA